MHRALMPANVSGSTVKLMPSPAPPPPPSSPPLACRHRAISTQYSRRNCCSSSRRPRGESCVSCLRWSQRAEESRMHERSSYHVQLRAATMCIITHLSHAPARVLHMSASERCADVESSCVAQPAPHTSQVGPDAPHADEGEAELGEVREHLETSAQERAWRKPAPSEARGRRDMIIRGSAAPPEGGTAALPASRCRPARLRTDPARAAPRARTATARRAPASTMQ